MIQLKSTREVELMAQGGQILGQTIRALSDCVRPGMTTAELDGIAEQFIRSHDGATPAFKGLYGFPGSICTSINDEIERLRHGGSLRVLASRFNPFRVDACCWPGSLERVMHFDGRETVA